MGMLSTKKKLAAGVVAAMVLIGGFPATAQAATTSASGSHSCRPGEQVYLRITLDSYGPVIVSGGSQPIAQSGTDLFITLKKKTASWKVSAPTGVATINDGCTGM